MFIDNKYTKVYFKIIERAKSRNDLTEYFEIHHIIPRCISKDDSSENLVRLTAKEHYIVHLLLTKMCVNTRDKFRMLNAFQMIANCHSQNQNRITAKIYHKLKHQISQAKSILNSGSNNPFFGKSHTKETIDKILENRPSVKGNLNPMFGKSHTKESKEKITKTKQLRKHLYKDRSGTNHFMYGKVTSSEVKEKISQSLKGRTFSDETRKLLSETKKGKNNPNYGKVYTDEEKIQMSRSSKRKNIKLSGEEILFHRRQKAIKTCYILLSNNLEINESNISLAKKSGILGKTYPKINKILEILGTIPKNLLDLSIL